MSGQPALRLATEIAAQFRHVQADVAAPKIAAHIKRYWDPRMRIQLKDQVRLAGPGCDEYVRATAELLEEPGSGNGHR